MAIPLTDTFGFTPNKPNIDKRYLASNGQPYASVAAAETALASRLVETCIGLTVLVKESGWTEAKEYWVQPYDNNGVTAYHLVEKQPQIDTSGFATKTEVNAKQDALPSGNTGQMLKKTASGVEWDDMPSIEDGENTAVTLDGTIHVSAVDAEPDETAGVEITPHIGGGVDMKFILPKGDTGNNGSDGQDGAPGHNPCLGRFTAVPSTFAETPRAGDYYYVDTVDSSTNPPTVTETKIYKYDGTQWDAGAVVDVNNLTFNSGESITGTSIDGTGLANPAANALAKAEDVKEMGDGIMAEIVDVVNLPFTYDLAHTVKVTGYATTSSQNYGCHKTDVSQYIGKTIKYKGYTDSPFNVGAAFFSGDTIMASTYLDFKDAADADKIGTAIVPEGATVFACTVFKNVETDEDKNKDSYYINVQVPKLDGVEKDVAVLNGKVTEMEGIMYDWKELPVEYDGSNVVKATGYSSTSSQYYGLNETDVSQYIGKEIKFLGAKNSVTHVGAAFFDSNDVIIDGSFVDFYNAQGGVTFEYTTVVPDGAIKFACTVHSDTNLNGYYVKVQTSAIDVIREESDENIGVDYPCYHTGQTMENFGSYADLIAAYDALVTAYHHYVFKSELSADGVTGGLCSDGVNKLYEYRFAMPNYNDSTHTNNNRSRDAQIDKPKILICAGVHGYEISAITSVYIFAKDLCKGKGVLAALSAGYDIRIIPSCNPWGMDNNRRGNKNGVDLNRNFVAAEQNWEASTAPSGASYDYTVNCGIISDYATNSTPTAATYTPGTVGDQPETKLVMAWAAANADAVAFFDTHNSLYNNEYGYIGALSGLDEPIKRHCFHSVDMAIPYFINERKLRYPYKTGSSAEAVFLYSGGGTKGYDGMAGTMSQYRLSNGMNGGTLEFCHTITTQTGTIAQYSAMIGTIGAEALGNILMGIAEAFNVSKVKTICAGSAMPKGGRDFVVIAWNTTTNKPQMWNGTEWVTLQVEQ